MGGRLKQLPDLLDQPLHAFDLESVTYREGWGTRGAAWMDYTEPEILLPYLAGAAGTVSLHLDAEDGTRLRTWTDEAERGLNYPAYDISVDADRVDAFNRGREEDARLEAAENGVVYLKPGTYTIVYEQDGTTARATLTVEAPPERNGAAEPEYSSPVSCYNN